MSIDALRELVPAYAKDLSLNLSTLANETTLSEQQKWGTFLACAYAVGVPDVVKNIEAAASAVLTPEAATAAKAAAAIMGMNNVYYRALHLMHNKEYETLRAGLRMNILGNPASTRSISSCGRSAFRRSMAAACASTATKRCCARTT